MTSWAAGGSEGQVADGREVCMCMCERGSGEKIIMASRQARSAAGQGKASRTRLAAAEKEFGVPRGW